ncbi:hypothetical protein KKB71_02725 [Patescibacteria group bacterium]|nr:hypothetical protein [Patescibacteria group bacterium]MBU2263414.1 hypothetical protein [Patescibacteria group bacterium]
MPKTDNKAIFWDYDMKKSDISKPKAKIWYLNRKLQFGDLKGIKKSDLKKHLYQLNIDPNLRELLKNYLAKNARH